MSRGPHYEKGRYLGRITAQALGQANTGNPQFVLRFVVLGRVNPADPQGDLFPCESYERTMYRVITENTIKYLTEDLETLGFQGESFRDLDPSSANCHNFVGQEHEFYCSHQAAQDGNGMREQWGVAKATTALEVKPLEAKQMRDLDNLFGKALKGIKKPAGKPAAKPIQEELAAVAGRVEPARNDDIPF